jgi:hypothetical protein
VKQLKYARISKNDSLHVCAVNIRMFGLSVGISRAGTLGSDIPVSTTTYERHENTKNENQ